MSSTAKRRQTAAKREREQALRDRRARKQQKKDDRKAAAEALANGEVTEATDDETGELGLEADGEDAAGAERETASEQAH